MREEKPTSFGSGIYFGLDEEAYRDDPALGSTDIRKLRHNPASYWFESWMNPDRSPEKKTPGRTRGSAMHKLLLEGYQAFDALYISGPRHSEDMTSGEKAAATKAANKEAAAQGKTAIPAEDYDRVVISAAMITKNPALSGAFSGGMSEVSVFWDRDGIRRKARFDYLKVRGVGDLKGVANTKGIAFPAACRNDITNYSYHVQSGHYLEARAMIPRFVADGCVYGDHDAEWLKRVAASKIFGWQWIFFQMESAPITWSAILSPENTILEIARIEIERATAAFKEYTEKFGASMWLLIEDPQELALEELPPWFGR